MFVVVVGFFSFSLALFLLSSQFQSSSEKTRRKDETSRAWTRWPSDVWSIPKHLSSSSTILIFCTLGVKDIDEATRNEMANKNKSNTTKTQWNVASSLGEKTRSTRSAAIKKMYFKLYSVKRKLTHTHTAQRDAASSYEEKKTKCYCRQLDLSQLIFFWLDDVVWLHLFLKIRWHNTRKTFMTLF